MTDCDRCGDEIEGARVVLRNAYYDGPMVSALRSKMVVCEDCRDEMHDSEDWEL